MHVTLEASACQPVCMVNVSKSSQLCKADEMEQWKCIELICQQRIKANRFLTVAGSKQLPYNRVYTYIIHTVSSRKYNS